MFDLDDDTIGDILDSFHELYAEVESTLALLNQNNDTEDLNKIFRAIHTIKGHAAMFQLTALINFTHALEEIAESLRSGHYPATDSVCECIQLGMDRLRDLHLRELEGQQFPNLDEQTIETRLIAIAKAKPTEVDELSNALIKHLGAGVDIPVSSSSKSFPDQESRSTPSINPLTLESSQQVYADLAFFQEISFQMDSQNPFWVDRSIQLFDWAQKLNALGGNAVDYQQLSAATYMHDIGMSLIPYTILSKNEALNQDEYNEIKRHTVWGYEFLNRMQGWEEAATIVLQHHEWVDGHGYPSELSGEEIHPGAKILAILDAFFSMINGRADRNYRRSTIRAISEINAASGSQFDPYWVERFSEMIKQEVKSGSI